MARTKPKLGNTHVPDILRFEIAPGEAAYKRITIQLREVILSKALPPGTRLPTLAELARLWKTNYFTVQTALTPLVNQGLLMRRQRKGTFVAGTTPEIKAVGIYFGASFWQVRHVAFYQALHAALCEYFERLGITVQLFMDSRPREQQGTPWKVLTDAVECREVNAVISAMTTSEEVSWLEELPVPLTMIGGATYHSVDIGLSNFLRNSLVRLKERKCRSVALISGGEITDFETFQKMAEEAGLKTRREWALVRDACAGEFEEFGFDSFCRIWKGATKPDGLIVFPDHIAPGVAMAILQQGAKVPEQLKLVMHCNEEVYAHCPLAADWQVVSIGGIVKALWTNLRAQAEGKTPKKAASCLTIQPETAELPPMHRKWRSGQSLFEQP
ncbi:MAG: GntR family transcriptional regulator [Verrucomicrobia bacterium]|nr:GntR family transcriptional regulator [Verrucomicrobiota bacterium]